MKVRYCIPFPILIGDGITVLIIPTVQRRHSLLCRLDAVQNQTAGGEGEICGVTILVSATCPFSLNQRTLTRGHEVQTEVSLPCISYLPGLDRALADPHSTSPAKTSKKCTYCSS